MSTCRTHALPLILLASLTASGDFQCAGSTHMSDGDTAFQAAVLPTDGLPPSFSLDGTVWSIASDAEAMSGECGCPLGSFQTLCAVEWRLVAVPADDGLYQVQNTLAGSFFMARLCGEDLYLDGDCAIALASSGCGMGASFSMGTIMGSGSPPNVRLTFASTHAPFEAVDSATGMMRLEMGGGQCDWDLPISMTRLDPAALASEPGGPGNLVLSGDAALAAELARTDLGLLLATTEGLPTWLPMQLLAESDALEIELAPGTWSVSLAPRPARSPAAGSVLGFVVIESGAKASWNWALPAARR